MSETDVHADPEPAAAPSPPHRRRFVLFGAAAALAAALGAGVYHEATVDALEAERHKLQEELANQHQKHDTYVATTESQLESQSNRLQDQTETIADKQQDLDRLGRISSLLAGVEPATVLDPDIQAVHELPGYGDKVSAADRRSLQESTVQLVRRPAGTDGAWSQDCTGLKVSNGAKHYVATARHCITRGISGLVKGGGSAGQSAANLTNLMDYEYGVTYPLGMQGTEQPVEIVDIAVSGRTDWALLEYSTEYANNREFRDMPSLPYEEYLSADDPQPGESAVIYSMTTASRGEQIESEGVYLGRAPNMYHPEFEVYVVGLPEASAAEYDGCSSGGSGSAAVLAGGLATGPLANRNNLTFDVSPGYDLRATRTERVTERVELDAQLGADTSSFDTLCFFVTGDTSDVGEMAAALGE